MFAWGILWNNVVKQKQYIEQFYLTRKTVNNKQCKIATNKQKNTIELVHNNYFTVLSKITLWHGLLTQLIRSTRLYIGFFHFCVFINLDFASS